MREELAEYTRSVFVNAHRNAKHTGRFEHCADPMCAALEEWLYHETRPRTPGRGLANVAGSVKG